MPVIERLDFHKCPASKHLKQPITIKSALFRNLSAYGKVLFKDVRTGALGHQLLLLSRDSVFFLDLEHGQVVVC